MLAKLTENKKQISAAELARANHALMVLPKSATLPGEREVPGIEVLQRALKRTRKKADALLTSPVLTSLPGGGIASWVMVDSAASTFVRHALLRKALATLFAEQPRDLLVAVFGDAAARAVLAADAAYIAWVNGEPLPARKKKHPGPPLQKITVYGHVSGDGWRAAMARAEGTLLCRDLTVLPPNELTPASYRKRIVALAGEYGWKCEEFDFSRLKKMGAGAFCAVAQGSPERDAAIVHLAYRPRAAKRTVALVGKGICFDTGGHNLKTARYMHGMHEDMNGSAVVVGALVAATRMKLPVAIDAWLAISRNDISPAAYRQNDVVTALNGTTIEIVHTDAEGRMVLADTLTLAAEAKPDLIVDFATLTGSMHVALGSRMSGVFSNREEWKTRAASAGQASGERVLAFPMDDDYDEALESKIADVKQCTLEGEADHILAARFLSRFVGDLPWIHMDLSASNCKGGLGAVATDVTGFGVGWTATLLRDLDGVN